MHTIIRYLQSTLLSVLCLTLSSLSYATAILDIVPTNVDSRTIAIALEGCFVVNYIVTNNTKVAVSNLTIDPSYGISGSALTLRVQNNQCTGSVAAGASCAFDLLVHGTGVRTIAVLAPRVCAFSGATCSIASLSNRITIRTLSIM